MMLRGANFSYLAEVVDAKEIKVKQTQDDKMRVYCLCVRVCAPTN